MLERLGARALDVTLDPGNEASVTVLRAEAWAYHEPTVARSPELYQPETLRRIRGGTEITAAAYIQARRRVDELRHHARQLFDGVDLLVTPTTPVPPPAIDALLADAAELRAKEFVMLRNTRPFNTLGLPTVSVPCGFTSDGLPIGLQITGAAGDETQRPRARPSLRAGDGLAHAAAALAPARRLDVRLARRARRMGSRRQS